MDGFATAISFALQYGVPPKFLVDKFSHVRFEPGSECGSLMTRNRSCHKCENCGGTSGRSA